MKKKKVLISIIAIALVAIVSLIGYLIFRGNQIEFNDLGKAYEGVFLRNTIERTILFVSTFGLAFVFTQIVNRGIKKGIKPHLKEGQKTFLSNYGVVISLVLSIIAGYLVQSYLAGQFLTLFNLAWFGKKDSIFNLDYSYFVIVTPIIKNILQVIMIYAVAMMVYITGMYIFTINKYTEGISFEELKTSKFLKQIITMVYVFTISTAIYSLLSHQDILVGDMLKNRAINGIYLTGAGFLDVNFRIWGLRIISLLLIYSVIRFVSGLKKENSQKMVTSIFIVPIAIVVLFGILFIAEKVAGTTNELDTEKSYIEHNINATKEAYNLNNLENNEIEKAEELTAEKIKNLKTTLNNIPIISKDIILNSFENTKEYDGMYKFNNPMLQKTDKGFVYTTPREVDLKKEKTNSDKVYKYTHGNGVVVTSANKVNKLGSIENISENYKETELNGIKIKEPRIYYGLNTVTPAITNSKQGEEIDYPISLTEFAKNTYNGKGGLELSFLDRLALAISTKNNTFLFNSNYKKDTKTLLNRDILYRAKKAIPNFIYDKNPYMVADENGNLLWAIDAYTMTDRYPYSQKLAIEGQKGGRERINYIRNSVKVLVNAYTGEMKYYITDKNDPIAMTVYNTYKEIFNSYDEISETVKKQFVYPKYLFDIQARIISIYHNTKVDELYRGDDLWQAAGSDSTYIDQQANSDYVLLKEKDKEEKLSIMSVYTPKNKKSINAYLIGENENGKLKLKLNRFAKNDNLLIMDYIKSQIAKDSTIQEEIKGIGALGTETKSTPMLVPIENTMLYIEPIYQTYINEKTSPVLKKVIVANGTKVAIGNDLSQAINNLFTNTITSLEIRDYEAVDVLVEAIIKQNKELDKSLKTNNLEYIGKDTEKLKSLIKQLEEAKTREEKENANKPVSTENVGKNKETKVN